MSAAGEAYVTAQTAPATGTVANPSVTNNFPTTAGAVQTTFGGGTGPRLRPTRS